MNTVDRLNKIVDYVEEHIDEELDMEAIAEIACLSQYDTQRMFRFIAEMSLAEYVRKRRLTLAGYALKNEDAKVINVALKYGYDSPVSFAHAFQKFHGITPSMAKKSGQPLRMFHRLRFQITKKEVMHMIRSEKMTVNGKTYDASYYGEADMSAWSEIYSKREFWRLENAWDDFKDCPRAAHVLPYTNYPPMEIQVGQVFVIDYRRKDNGKTERRYYIADGTVWKDMDCTAEIYISTDPLKFETLTVGGKTYTAEYYGSQNIGYWSERYRERVFRRLRDAYEDFRDLPQTGDVLPYNNYPPMVIELGQVFVIDYYPKNSDDVERRCYISDGTTWNNMDCTAEVIVKE